MKIKRKHWDTASQVLDVLLEALKERGHLRDEEYGALLEKAVATLEEASEYAYNKSLSKKELKEINGDS